MTGDVIELSVHTRGWVDRIGPDRKEVTALDRSYIDSDELSLLVADARRSATCGSPCRVAAALSSISRLCATVADNSARLPEPALGTPGGVDQLAWVMGEVTAEVIGNRMAAAQSLRLR